MRVLRHLKPNSEPRFDFIFHAPLPSLASPLSRLLLKVSESRDPRRKNSFPLWEAVSPAGQISSDDLQTPQPAGGIIGPARGSFCIVDPHFGIVHNREDPEAVVHQIELKEEGYASLLLTSAGRGLTFVEYWERRRRMCCVRNIRCSSDIRTFHRFSGSSTC